MLASSAGAGPTNLVPASMPRRLAPPARSLLAAGLLVLGVLLGAARPASALELGFVDDAPVWSGGGAALARQAGARTGRVWVRWDHVEARPGAYDWTEVDTANRVLRAHGLRPLWVVLGAPASTLARGCTRVGPCPPAPTHHPAYQRFLGALTARTRGSAGYEIWNEPNLSKFWAGGADPAAYTALLKAAHTAIKAADPAATVIAAGLCAGRPAGEMRQAQFLQGMYAAGARGHMDAIATHLYPNRNAWPAATDIRLSLDELRPVREAAGDASPFWITEMGQTTGGGAGSPFTTFTEAEQADRLSSMFRVLASMPDVRAAYVFRLIEGGAPLGSADASMGVYRADRTPKAAVRALRDALSAPPWPTYQLQASLGVPTAPVKAPVTATVTGYGGPEPVTYEWRIWHGDHWSNPIATSASPTTQLAFNIAGTWRIGARMITGQDSYEARSTSIVVTRRFGPGAVTPAPAPAPAPRVAKVRRKLTRCQRIARMRATPRRQALKRNPRCAAALRRARVR